MPFKPNYNQARMERDRRKAAKKEEKLREKQERRQAVVRDGAEEDPVPEDDRG